MARGKSKSSKRPASRSLSGQGRSSAAPRSGASDRGWQELRSKAVLVALFAVAAIVAGVTLTRIGGGNQITPVARSIAASGSSNDSLQRDSRVKKGPDATAPTIRDQPAGPPISEATLNDDEALLTEQLQIDRIDLHKASWPSEVFTELANQQLTELGKLIVKSDSRTADDCRPLVDAQFKAMSLRPTDLETVFDDGEIVVRRSRNGEPPQSHRGAAGLAQELHELTEGVGFTGGPHVKLKIIIVEVVGDVGSTSVLVQIDGPIQGGTVQQNAVWNCKWRRRGEQAPLLLEIVGDDDAYQQVAYRGNADSLFSDVTQAVLGANDCLAAQFGPGTSYWLARMETALGADLVGANGLAVGDVDGDGREDVYLCQPGGLPNRLFIANADGTATERASEYGVDFLDYCSHALLIDLDNDGDQDLVTILINDVVFWELDQGRYRRRDRHEVPSGAEALAAADFDLDGLLDVYIVNHDAAQADRGVFGLPVPFHDANNGGANALLHNGGDFAFENVTGHVGLDQNNSRFSFAAAWADYDRDGDPDLYVANDFGRNNLYRNDEGRFTDVAAEAGVEDISAGMSVSWGDSNNDGLLDLYVGNMFSSAGNRVAYQRQFAAKRNDETVAQMQRHARGNSLFENLGDGTFRDVSVASNATMGRWAWASPMIDVNNDGWQDLLIANGFITGNDPDDL